MELACHIKNKPRPARIPPHVVKIRGPYLSVNLPRPMPKTPPNNVVSERAVDIAALPVPNSIARGFKNTPKVNTTVEIMKAMKLAAIANVQP